MAVVRVSIEMESLVIVDDGDAEALADRLRASLELVPPDPDLVLWLLEVATVRSVVTG